MQKKKKKGTWCGKRIDEQREATLIQRDTNHFTGPH